MKASVRIRRFGVGLSVALNVLVVALVVWLAAGGMVTLGRAYIVEPTYERSTSQWDQLPVEAGDTVFLGDSLTDFGDWDELFPGAHVKNRGIAGDDTAGVLARVDQVTDGRPAQVFLLIGTNDLAAGEDEGLIVSNVQEIVDRIHIESPATEVFVQSVLPRGDNYREDIESLNERLRVVAGEQDATWVDLYPLFLDEDGSIADQYSNDEVHLMGDGYLVWRAAIAEHVTTSG